MRRAAPALAAVALLLTACGASAPPAARSGSPFTLHGSDRQASLVEAARYDAQYKMWTEAADATFPH